MFALPSPFYKNGLCVKEAQALIALRPPHGVSMRGQAGLVINELSNPAGCTHPGKYLVQKKID